MTTSIEQLRDKRKKWVAANRENGFEDGLKRLLSDLYPDSAHFVYELLQNAEDAHASEARFYLNDDGVEFWHNGSRLFKIENVDAITSIGTSTKADDTTSIGKFGVGFKAVFAYTSTPEIESGEFHFRIRDMVVPDTTGLSPALNELRETRFVFPFDNPKKPAETAREEIERGLRELDESTLIFLSYISKIDYQLPNGQHGWLERKRAVGNRIEVLTQRPEDVVPESAAYMRFDRVADVTDEDGDAKSCRISIAFSLERADPQGSEGSTKPGQHDSTPVWRIKPAVPGETCIYFPADKETSNLRFHVHAPFASTVARDSVRDCGSNNELRDHLAALVADSLATIRDHGLLTVDFLATLPNDKDNLSAFYKPILDGLINEFNHQDLRLIPLTGPVR